MESCKVITWITSPDALKPLLEQWEKEHNGSEFGIEITWPDVMADLQWMISGPASDILVLIDESEPVGFIALMASSDFPMFAAEKYYYVERKKGLAAYMLVGAAKKWAKDKGCSHLIMSASYLAGDRHDTLCKFYRAIGMKDFETAFICEV